MKKAVKKKKGININSRITGNRAKRFEQSVSMYCGYNGSNMSVDDALIKLRGSVAITNIVNNTKKE